MSLKRRFSVFFQVILPNLCFQQTCLPELNSDNSFTSLSYHSYSGEAEQNACNPQH